MEVGRHVSPYGHLGLFWNPFGEVEHAAWRDLIATQVDLDDLARRLESPDFVVTLRGESGRGKSTHLRALHARFADLPFTYLPPQASPLTHIPRAKVVFVDEVERLGRWQRRRLFRRRSALALACHGDLSDELARAGREHVDLEIAGLDEARLVALVRKRIERARRDGNPGFHVARQQLCALLDRYGDDLRAINHALYERVEATRRNSLDVQV